MNVKKCIAALLSAAAVFSSIPCSAGASADSPNIGITPIYNADIIGENEFIKGDFRFGEQPDGTLAISSLKEKRSSFKNVTIPSSMNGKKVTVIAESAFRGCKNLESISIPETINAIGSSAFEDCVKLETAEIPEGVETIKNSAFCYCSGLKSVVLPKSLAKIQALAFDACSGLTDVYYRGTKEQWEKVNITFEIRSFMWDGDSYPKTNSALKKAAVHYNYDPSAQMLAAPTGIKVSKTASSLKLSWDKKTGADSYVVKYSTDKTTWKTKTVTANSATITGLKANTKYYYKVAATNSAGDGTYTKVYSSTTASKLSAPANVKPTQTASSLKLSWDKVSGASSYVVKYSTDNKNWKTKTVTANSATITGLKANTKYYYKVAAKNSSGTGTYSKTYTAVTKK